MNEYEYNNPSHMFKQARLDKRLSQQKLAEKAGVAQLSIFRLEHNQNVSLEFLQKVAQGLGYHLEIKLVNDDHDHSISAE